MGSNLCENSLRSDVMNKTLILSLLLFVFPCMAITPGTIFTYTEDDEEEHAVYEFRVNSDGENVTLISGKTKGMMLLSIPGTVRYDGEVFVVNSIGEKAFYTDPDNGESPIKGIRKIFMPEWIRSVGNEAFGGAPDLEAIRISPVQSSISPRLFANCTKLQQINSPGEVMIDTIGSYAFENCISLKSFTIPQSVTEIQDAPWKGCVSLESIGLAEDNYYFRSVNGVIYDSSYEQLIQYPSGKKENEYVTAFGVEEVCNSAFSDNPYIETVRLPGSLKVVKPYAFSGCRSLENVIFNSKDVAIGRSAFQNCIKLSSVELYGRADYIAGEGAESSFPKTTQVRVEGTLPPINLAADDAPILEAAYAHVAGMPYFGTKEIENNEDYYFPSTLGKGKFAAYGNAGPRPDVLHILESVPASYLSFENVDERGRIIRIYLDERNPDSPEVLYFFGGIGGNDLVVALFSNGNLKDIHSYIERMKEEVKGE